MWYQELSPGEGFTVISIIVVEVYEEELTWRHKKCVMDLLAL